MIPKQIRNLASVAPKGPAQRSRATGTSGTMRRADPLRRTEPPLEWVRPVDQDLPDTLEPGPFSSELHGGCMLVRTSGVLVGQVCLLDQSEIRLGRAEDADIRSTDPNVSREHARIVVRGASFWLEDMDSSRGTRVNGQLVDQHCLKEGDLVELGPGTRFRYSAVPPLREAYAAGMYDELTSAHSALYFETVLKREVAFSQRNGGDCALVSLDLDGFSEFNENFGYRAGDVVLRQVATTCSLFLRVEDVLARQGDDSFVILLPATNAAGAEVVAGRVLASIRDQWLEIGKELRMITTPASVSSAALSECSRSTYDALLSLTRVRLVAARELGGNRVISKGG